MKIYEIEGHHKVLETLRGIGNQHMVYATERNLVALERLLIEADVEYRKTEQAQALEAHHVGLIAQAVAADTDAVAYIKEHEDKDIKTAALDAHQTIWEGDVEFKPYLYAESRLREITIDELPPIPEGVTEAVHLNTFRARLNFFLVAAGALCEDSD